ncbi:NTP transferase domain-containing protein [Peptostreptococcus equinus]|uniref:NTP transferase domain-containing protein n=1 Tax=Peptostreptococcus equinus TaxID=3003601 RepID=A0ABY7JMK0_9FIRM|nr:NTP transferase domain-containing protein [Peptostreptococcus sp. CBA3647]WAW14590.1 NTP transferase domain-containing protein [Peptostreptococcus sp. CBA3647]
MIVAAGLSSRMKAFKPSLPFGDSTVANHTITKLKKLNIDPITVVVGHKSEELKNSIFFDDIRYVKNENYSETQMFDSVVLGVNDIMNLCDRIMIMPMDLPAILEETLIKVLSIDSKLVRTTYKGQPGHPIIVTNDFAKSLVDYNGVDGLRGAMEAYESPITNVEVEDAAVFLDIDTPEEYHELIEWNYQRGKGYPVGPQVEVKLRAREVFFDETAYNLLINIDSQKSIQQACSSVGISYSKGSKIIKEIERELGFPVVEKRTGGAGGGGSLLTKEGIRLVDNYSKLVEEMRQEMEKKYKKYFAMGLRV